MISRGRGASLAKTFLHSPKRRPDGSVLELPMAECDRSEENNIEEALPARTTDETSVANVSVAHLSCPPGSNALQRWRARHGLLRGDACSDCHEEQAPERAHRAGTSPPCRVGALELLQASLSATVSGSQRDGNCAALRADVPPFEAASPNQSRVRSPSLSPLGTLQAKARARSTSPHKRPKRKSLQALQIRARERVKERAQLPAELAGMGIGAGHDPAKIGGSKGLTADEEEDGEVSDDVSSKFAALIISNSHQRAYGAGEQVEQKGIEEILTEEPASTTANGVITPEGVSSSSSCTSIVLRASENCRVQMIEQRTLSRELDSLRQAALPTTAEKLAEWRRRKTSKGDGMIEYRTILSDRERWGPQVADSLSRSPSPSGISAAISASSTNPASKREEDEIRREDSPGRAATTLQAGDVLKLHDVEGVHKDLGVETRQAIDDMQRMPVCQMPNRREQDSLIGNKTERMVMGHDDWTGGPSHEHDRHAERQADRKGPLERWRVHGGAEEGRRRGRSGHGCASLRDHEDNRSPQLRGLLGLKTGSPDDSRWPVDSNAHACRDAFDRDACVSVHQHMGGLVRRTFPTDEYVTAIDRILGKTRTTSPTAGARALRSTGMGKLEAVDEVVKFIEDKTRFAESPHRLKRVPSYSPRPAHAREEAGASNTAAGQGHADESGKLDVDVAPLHCHMDSHSSSFLGPPSPSTPRKIPPITRRRLHPEAIGQEAENQMQGTGGEEATRLRQDATLPQLSPSGTRHRERGSSSPAEDGTRKFALLVVLLVSSILLNLGFAVAHFGREL